ncbi:S8 family serine peptidase [Deinococcus sp. QL22]|uniref:S8 family peptidase n=1 Tax=Deinococcus sp. QL22 TaxID=2939437 RepID=UPI0020179D0B|nr:S8 family serine peptidase [Deinococcus sp. QL22]UQN08023.1 S8 family serine peptidase [Deinococcus sp. QL22]
MDEFMIGESLPAFHDGMLLIKMNSQGPAATAIAQDTAGGTTFMAAVDRVSAATTGLAALSFYERAGLISQVVPLSANTNYMQSAVATTMAAATNQVAGDDLGGVSIVQLTQDQEANQLHRILSSDPNVAYISRVPTRYLLAKATGIVGGIPPAPTRMWNLNRIGWEPKIVDVNEAKKIRVGVFDTGVDVTHPDLMKGIARYTVAYPDLPGNASEQDIVGHGTHVTGTIGAGINDDVGINGICRSQLLVWKIFNDTPTYLPRGNVFWYLVDPLLYRRALNDCLQGSLVDVLNLSIGGPQPPDQLEHALYTKLLESGVTIVAAMGNERQQGSPISYPAAIPGVIAVGATGLNDTVASFSNAGNHITLCAPGVAIWSTVPTYPGQVGYQALPGPGGAARGRSIARETNYAAFNGTSMAAPHVSAAVALLLAKGTKPADVLELLKTTADPVPGMRGQTWHPDYGAGRLNLRRLLSA